MNIECSVEQLKTVIQNAERCTSKNATLPALQSILIIARNKSLIIKATNLSIGIEYSIPAKIITEGVVALPGMVFSNIINTIRDGSVVTLIEKEQTMVISSKNTTIRVKTLPYEDFPTIPVVPGDAVELPIKKLIEGIKAVAYSASVSDIKPEIASIFIYPEEDELVFVATDSFRLAEKRIKIKNARECTPCIIPIKNCVEIMRIFDGMDGEITLTFSENQLTLQTSGIIVSSRVINGSFPDYKQIIPKTTNTEIIILKQDLLNTVKMATIFTDKFNQIQFSCDPQEKKVIFETKNADIGEHKTAIDAVIKGAPIEVNFNFKYIFDCLTTLGEDSVSLSFTEAHKPCIIRPIGNTSFLYLLMPMNR